MDNSAKIIFFIGNNAPAYLLANRMVVHMRRLGVEPVIYVTPQPTGKIEVNTALQDFSFYDTHLIDRHIHPYLDAADDLLGGSGLPRSYLNYSPAQLRALHNVQVEPLDNVNDEAFINTIVAEPEIIGGVSLRNMQIFKPELINVFKEKGFLWNLHTGLLPEYRGVLMPFRALEAGEQEYGWALHDVIVDIDSGDILSKFSVPLTPDKPVLDLYLDLVSPGASMVSYHVHQALNGEQIAHLTQDTHEGRYFTYPSAYEIRRFHEQGYRLVAPETVADTFCNLYSLAGTAHCQGLYAAINTAISSHQLSLNPPDDPAGPSGDATLDHE